MSRVRDAGADPSSSPRGPWACLVTWSASEREAAGAPVLPVLNMSKDPGGVGGKGSLTWRAGSPGPQWTAIAKRWKGLI